jgi:hypothetical protein
MKRILMKLILPKMALRLELDCQISGKQVKYYVNYGQKLRYQIKGCFQCMDFHETHNSYRRYV